MRERLRDGDVHARKAWLGTLIQKIEVDERRTVSDASAPFEIELKLAIEGGGNPKAVTSRYDGTALIAAAILEPLPANNGLYGTNGPLARVRALKAAFQPGNIQVSEQKRGVLA